MNWIDHILLHYLHYLLHKNNIHVETIQSRLEKLRFIFEAFDKIPTPDELEEWLKITFRYYITRRKYKKAYEDFVEFLREVLRI